MAIATIQEALDRGYVSTYLAGNYNARKKLFGGVLSPVSDVTIAMTTDALQWGYDGGAQTDESLRRVANYLVWICGMFGQSAQSILSGGGGGSVTPVNPPVNDVYPFVIRSDDFESDGTSYINEDIVGDNLMIFINEYTQQWLFAPDSFVYTATGIQIVVPGFDANTNDYTIVIQKRNNG